MAWGKAGSTTLTSAGDALTQSTISNSNTYIYLYHAIPSGELTEYMTMGSGGTKDTGSNYSNRVSSNGATDSEYTSRANIVNASKSGATKPEFGIGYGVNIATEEKLIMTYHSNVSSAGAGTAPDRNEAVGKHKQVSAVLNTISFDNTGSGDFASGSTLNVLGSELTPAVAVPAIDNVQNNSLFLNRENGNRYWFTSEVNNLTFEDDFSGADNWSKSPSDSQFAVDTSDDRLEFLENASSGGDRCWYDLGASAVSSTKWLFRAKFRFTTIATQSDYPEFDFGLSDNTENSDTQQNFMGFRCLPMSANNLFRPRVCTGASGDAGKPRRGASASYNPSPAFTTGTDYYVEIKRTSASNWSCTLSTTNAFDGDIVGGSFTDASGVTDLRYIKIMDGTTATSGDMAGYVDDVEFYNNATTPTTPATWYGEGAEKFYDTSATSSNADYFLQSSAGHGTRAGVTVLAGSDAINRKIQYVKFKLRKFSSPSGNYQITVRDSNDTVKATANFDVTALPTTEGLVEHDLGSEVLLAEGDRILFEYGGASGTQLYYDTTSGTSGFSATLYNYSSAYVTDATDTVIGIMDSQGASI